MNAPVRANYETVTTIDRLNELLRQAAKQGYLAFDTETDSLDAHRANLVGIAISVAPMSGAYVPIAHQTDEPQLDLQTVLDKIKPVLEQPFITKIMQNGKFDVHIMRRYGVSIEHISDSMLMAYSMHAGKHRFNMDDLSMLYLGHQTITFKQVAGDGTFDQVPIPPATSYSAEDADVTLRLAQLFYKQLEKDLAAAEVSQLDHAVARVVAKMEQRGVLVDAKYLDKLTDKFEAERNRRLDEAVAVAGVEFNPASPPQVAALLTERMGVTLTETTATGRPCVDEEVLEGIAASSDPRVATLVKSILSWREYNKLIGTYTIGLKKQINPETGRIHPSFGLAHTITGRLSCSDPNVQNIPIRTPEGKLIRAAFVAPAGRKIISADYSQIELRVLAHAAGDDALFAAFDSGRDIHKEMASFVFNVPYDQVDADTRRNVKEITFGIIYGKTAWGLARTLGISESEAQDIIATYFARFPGIEGYVERARQMAVQYGYVQTLIGRKIWLPDVKSSNKGQRNHALRAAQNAPIQGSAADIIRAAMVKVENALEGTQTKLLMQVHDELVFESPDAEVDEAMATIKAVMESAVDYLDAPLVVDVNAKQNWLEAH